MHFTTLILAVAASFAAVTSAASQSFAPVDQSSTSTQCYTHMASTSPLTSPKTEWHTSYTDCTTKRIITRTTTSRPVYTTTVTSSCTDYVTAAPSVLTATVFSTTTYTETDTSTSTSTSTELATVFTSTSTSTVPAPAAFTPVQDILPGASYDGSGGADPVHKRAASKLSNTSPNVNSLQVVGGKSRYPDAVRCYEYVPGTCHPKKMKVVVTTVTSPVTATSIAGFTVTSTVVPSATTTTTKTRTRRVTTTVTASTDFTTTVIVKDSASTTVYAACATNNLADKFNGAGIEFLGSDYAWEMETTPTYDAYDCCVAAITDPNSPQVFTFTPSTGTCAIFVSDGFATCNAQTDHPYIALTGPESIVLGNAGCGEVNRAKPYTPPA